MFQEIHIFPDINYLSKALDMDGFEQLADKLAVDFANENNLQIYDQNNTLTRKGKIVICFVICKSEKMRC
jgi:hypothetical protein